jgi:hypothetical protein
LVTYLRSRRCACCHGSGLCRGARGMEDRLAAGSFFGNASAGRLDDVFEAGPPRAHPTRDGSDGDERFRVGWRLKGAGGDDSTDPRSGTSIPKCRRPRRSPSASRMRHGTRGGSERGLGSVPPGSRFRTIRTGAAAVSATSRC